MAIINILDKRIAELIAAGEVVERPSSIVKELVENAVDAGASTITVEIAGGGVRFIRISDNGCGIPREELPKAFLRHATSKIRSSDDLEGILTMGFRGEALASVAAVCKVEITSKTADEDEGSNYKIEGGRGSACLPVGCPTGTTIQVRDVFYNTPARMKFLKKDNTEGSSVAVVVEKSALANPRVAFKFIRDGQLKLQTSGNGDLLSVIYSVYGKEMAKGMLPVDTTTDGIRVSGYVSAPQTAKSTRGYQNFFINSRYVRSRTCSAALEEAFKHKIMAGKFPACVLNLETDPHTVDVNVHPAKIEVRFENEKPVFSALYFAVKSALAGSGQEAIPQIEAPAARLNPFAPDQSSAPQGRMTAAEYRQTRLSNDGPVRDTSPFVAPMNLRSQNLRIQNTKNDFNIPFSDKINRDEQCNILTSDAKNSPVWDTITVEAIQTPPSAVTFEAPKPDYRLIGQLFGVYALLESGSDLVMVDKHAAHERLLYEAIRKSADPGNRQLLVTPVQVSLPHEDYSAAVENLSLFEEMGFLAEDFGGGAILIREVPIELSQADIRAIIEEAAVGIRENRRNLTPTVLDNLYESMACRSAIKAHDKSSPLEMEALMALLRDNPHVTHCPHGRPIFIRMGKNEIEKRFGRLG